MSSDYGYVSHRNLNNDTLGCNHHYFVIVINCFDSDYISCLFGNLVASYTLTATLLNIEFFKFCSLAHTEFGCDKKRSALMIELHSDDFITVCKIHASYTHSGSAHASYICFLEADAHTLLGNKINKCILIG